MIYQLARSTSRNWIKRTFHYIRALRWKHPTAPFTTGMNLQNLSFKTRRQFKTACYTRCFSSKYSHKMNIHSHARARLLQLLCKHTRARCVCTLPYEGSSHVRFPVNISIDRWNHPIKRRRGKCYTESMRARVQKMCKARARGTKNAHCAIFIF